MLDHRLELFIKIAEHGNITNVAAELYVSQPAISKQLKSLEQELNVKLFHRDKRNGMLLTNVGKKILLLAKQQAELVDRMYQTAYQENNFLGGRLRVASLPPLSTSMLAPVLAEYRCLYPHVSIEVFEGTPREVRTLVKEHSVDLSLTCSPFIDVDYDILIHDRLLAFFPENFSNPPEVINFQDGLEKLIFCRAGMETTMEELYEQLQLNFANTLMFDNPDTVVRMVECGLGIGILSEFTLTSLSHQLKTCPVKPEFPIEIGIVANDLTDLTPVAQAFYELLHKHYGEHILPSGE